MGDRWPRLDGLAVPSDPRRDPGMGFLRVMSCHIDDNADDSCSPNYIHNGALRLLNSLFSDHARSWQPGAHRLVHDTPVTGTIPATMSKP
jgi:hypothetical protein